jgi:hypothetical protein
MKRHGKEFDLAARKGDFVQIAKNIPPIWSISAPAY